MHIKQFAIFIPLFFLTPLPSDRGLKKTRVLSPFVLSLQRAAPAANVFHIEAMERLKAHAWSAESMLASVHRHIRGDLVISTSFHSSLALMMLTDAHVRYDQPLNNLPRPSSSRARRNLHDALNIFVNINARSAGRCVVHLLEQDAASRENRSRKMKKNARTSKTRITIKMKSRHINYVISLYYIRCMPILKTNIPYA